MMIICRVCGWENDNSRATTCAGCGQPVGPSRRRAVPEAEVVAGEAAQSPAQSPDPPPAPLPAQPLTPSPAQPPAPPRNPLPARPPANEPSPTGPEVPARAEPVLADRAPVVAIGTRFQPLPQAQLVRCAGAGGAARIPAARGTPVHAITSGLIVAIEPSGILARGEDGLVYHYRGVAASVVAGQPVRAGDMIGGVTAGILEVRLTDPSGRPLDAVDALVGLPDPNELGLTASDRGVDPDALDRELGSTPPLPAEGV